MRRRRVSPPPPFEVNSNDYASTPGRGLPAFGLLMDFFTSPSINGKDKKIDIG